jgi:hypothetical protein
LVLNDNSKEMKNKLTYLFLVIFLAGFFVETSAKILPDETIFQLQFNKSLYVSGEKIWFKNSLVSGHNNDHQNILFVDLCGEGSIITSRILVRENDHWQGDIAIPDSLETGIYLFRAYTGNLDGKPEIVSKLVTVVNRFGNNQTNILRKANQRNKRLDLINLFPEQMGNILKTYTNSKIYKSKEIIECLIEKQKGDFPAGISYSVYKIPDSLSVDSMNYNPDQAESLVEYGDRKNIQIYNRLTLSGKVIGKISKMPVSGEKVLLSIPDSIPQINYATTNENGEFRFDMDDYYGRQDIIVQTLSKNEAYQIVLFSNFLDPPSRIPFYLSDGLEKSDFVKQAVQRALLQKSYETETEKIKKRSVFKYPFYGKASNIVIPDRFIDLNDFEEITKEILPLCRIRKQKDNYSLQLLDQSVYGSFNSPWILVDGIPVSDIKNLFPLNSPKIKRVETQPQVRCYGDLFIEGIMSVITTKGNFEDVPLPVNAFRTTFETFYQPSEYTGNHFVNDQNFADFKDVLYWNPILEPFSDISKVNVQSSYEKGSYIAVAQAIGKDGDVYRSVSRFKVE